MYQAEYAAKAVENAGTSIGIRCKDGIVLATEKIVSSRMLVSTSNRRIFTCDLNVGTACSGFAPDGRQLVNQLRDICAQYKEQYGVPIPPNQLADRMSQYMHAHTCYHYLRPFGAACLIAGYDEDQKKHELYSVKSDGLMFRMFGAAIGKGARGAQTEIERGKFQEKTCEESLAEIAKIISTIHVRVYYFFCFFFELIFDPFLGDTVERFFFFFCEQPLTDAIFFFIRLF